MNTTHKGPWIVMDAFNDLWLCPKRPVLQNTIWWYLQYGSMSMMVAENSGCTRISRDLSVDLRPFKGKGRWKAHRVVFSIVGA